MVKFKIEWSIEARLDLLDILDYYVIRNKSATYSKKQTSADVGFIFIAYNINPIISILRQERLEEYLTLRSL